MDEETREPVYARTGWARWMGASWLGHRTTTGEAFDPESLTAAHPTLPVPSFLYVTNRANGRTVLVRVNDKVPANPDRAVVVSQQVAELLAFHALGRAEVDLQYAGPAPVAANSKHELAFLEKQLWFRPDMLRPATGAQTRAAGPAAPDARERRDNSPGYPRWDNTRR